MSARERGLDTLVIEKMPVVGEPTAMSGGVLWRPPNPLMSEAGIPDSVEAGLEYSLQPSARCWADLVP